MTTRKQTKAERIFRNTYAASRNLIDEWGYTENSAWSHMDMRDDETMAMRTVNAIQKLIDREFGKLDFFAEQGMPMDNDELCRQALEMVQNTLDNERARLEHDNAYGRACKGFGF